MDPLLRAMTRTFARSHPGSLDRSRVVTYLTPPRLCSFPEELDQLEYSSRSFVFPRDGPRILRAWGSLDDPAFVAVEPARTRWKVTAWGVPPARARAAVRAIFSLDHPIEQFYLQLRHEPVLSSCARDFRGLRLPRDSGLFEALVHSVIGQQLSVSAANTIRRRLVESAGTLREVDGVSVPWVPGPRRFRSMGARRLRACGLSSAKVRTILGLAERETAGAFRGSSWNRAPAARAVERLDREPGVGRWTAENALLRGVGRTDLFVAGDLGVRTALAAYGVVPRNAPESEARDWADRHYPGWGSYATLYLWRRWVADGAPRDPGSLAASRASRRSE